MSELTAENIEEEIAKLSIELDHESNQNWVMALARRMANNEDIPDEDFLNYASLGEGEKMRLFCFMLGVMASLMEPPEQIPALV